MHIRHLFYIFKVIFYNTIFNNETICKCYREGKSIGKSLQKKAKQLKKLLKTLTR